LDVSPLVALHGPQELQVVLAVDLSFKGYLLLIRRMKHDLEGLYYTFRKTKVFLVQLEGLVFELGLVKEVVNEIFHQLLRDKLVVQHAFDGLNLFDYLLLGSPYSLLFLFQ